MNEVGFRRLKVWNEAHSLVLLIYRFTKQFPKSELFGLTNQFRRAAVSIPANIVEGYARQSRKEFRQFLYISEGSLAECEYYIELARDLKYVTDDQYNDLENQRKIVGGLLHGFIRSFEK